MESITFDKPVLRVEAIAPAHNDLLLLVLGKSDADNEFVVYDLAKKEILHQVTAVGPISRITVHRSED